MSKHYQCLHCGREIPRRAGLCLNCERRQMQLEHQRAEVERKRREVTQ